VLVTVAGCVAIVAAAALGLREYQKRRFASLGMSSGERDFAAAEWQSAATNLGKYLSRTPNDTRVTLLYARAQRRINPLTAKNLAQAVAAYRTVLRSDPSDEVYREYATLLRVTGQAEELAHLAELRLQQVPSDPTALVWMAEARLTRGRGA